MDVLRVILTRIPLFVVLVIGINLLFSRKKFIVKPDSPMPVVIALCTNNICGAILIGAVLIAAYV